MGAGGSSERRNARDRENPSESGSGTNGSRPYQSRTPPPEAGQGGRLSVPPQQVFVFQNGEFTSQGGRPYYMNRGGQLPGTGGMLPGYGGGPMRQPPIAPAQLKKTCVVKNPVNLKKHSLSIERDEFEPNLYYISFEYDSTADVEMNIYLIAKEEDHPPPNKFSSTAAHDHIQKTLEKGMKLTYQAGRDEAINLLKLPVEELAFSKDSETFPLVIQLCALGQGDFVQGQYTYAAFEATNRGGRGGGSWALRVLKQKVQYGDRAYEVQEIYGIERSGSTSDPSGDDLASGRECVICLANDRDTAVLPCRHMCLCNQCSNVMRMQSNKCPICRQTVTSLLQISVQDRKFAGPNYQAPLPQTPNPITSSNHQRDARPSRRQDIGPTTPTQRRGDRAASSSSQISL